VELLVKRFHSQRLSAKHVVAFGNHPVHSYTRTENVTISKITSKNNEPGGKMVWYPREMKRTNVSGVYPSSAGGRLGQDYREEE
jgi:hypothetical protein